MTDEEIEKEAEDFLKKSLKVDDDEFDFFKNEASCKEEIKRLTDFVEPREKRIAELEEKISILLSCKNCPENKGGYICEKEYEDKCLAQKIQYIKELKEENAELEKAYNEAEKLLDKQIEATYKLFEENKELKEINTHTLKKTDVLQIERDDK